MSEKDHMILRNAHPLVLLEVVTISISIYRAYN